MVSLQTIGFKSDVIEIIDGSVSVKKLCDNIGLTGINDQYKKIQSDESFQSEFKEIEINGIIQRVLCIPYNKVDGWLFSISVNRVKHEVKQKLIEYKNECFEVLHKHFNSEVLQPLSTNKTTELLVELLKTQQQQNNNILQVLNNQTQLFKNMQKQLEDTTRSVHYNSDTLLATQEALDINRKRRSATTTVYPTRVPQIDHKGLKPPKPTYLQKKILIAIEDLMSIKDVYENIDGENYYRITIEEISKTAMKKSNYSYICKHINFLVQHGHLRKVKLSSVCVVYALVPKIQTKGKR
jgi:hypothetical protein